MAKIICTLPNASELINGIRFVSHELGMISEEVEDEVAKAFVEIKGYVMAPSKSDSNPDSTEKKGPGRPSKKNADGNQLQMPDPTPAPDAGDQSATQSTKTTAGQ